MSANRVHFDNLLKRVLSAMVMVPVGVAVVYFGGWVLAIAAVLVGGLMWHEYFRVVSNQPTVSSSFLVGVVALSSVLAMNFIPIQKAIFLVGLTMIGAAFVFVVWERSRAAWLTLGLVLILATVFSLIHLRDNGPVGLVLVLSLMLCVWSADISAYFAGRGFGGPQLVPITSPNKTWSGAIAAIVCTGLIGVLIAGLIEAAIFPWLVFGVSVSLVAQIGDLLQSNWKRRFDRKDSGGLIPGHGGVLDRLDSFCASLIVLGVIVTVIPSLPGSVLEIKS